MSEVGYRNPPRHSRFRKKQSGNARGRPPGRKSEPPYEAILGQMVSVTVNGRQISVTAAEAYLLKLQNDAHNGDTFAIDALLHSKAMKPVDDATPLSPPKIIVGFVEAGSVGPVVAALGIGAKLGRFGPNPVMKLEPWSVEAALNRRGPNTLTISEQQTVWASTATPEKVRWPDWWSVRANHLPSADETSD